LVVEHPAEARLRRVLRVVIQVDRAAEVDPADQRELVLLGERGDLPGLARVRRRPYAPREVEVGAVAVRRRARPRLALELQRAPGSPFLLVWHAAQLRSRIGFTSRKSSTFFTPASNRRPVSPFASHFLPDSSFAFAVRSGVRRDRSKTS